MEEVNQLIPGKLPSGIFVGTVRGVYDLKSRINDGEIAASSCEAYLEGKVDSNNHEIAHEKKSCVSIFPHPKGNEFVDLDEDLKIKEDLITDERGFDSIELLKRYSTIGMGPSQGKLSNLNGIRIVAEFNRQPVGNEIRTSGHLFILYQLEN